MPRSFEEYAQHDTEKRADVGLAPETEKQLRESYKSFLLAVKWGGWDDAEISYEYDPDAGKYKGLISEAKKLTSRPKKSNSPKL